MKIKINLFTLLLVFLITIGSASLVYAGSINTITSFFSSSQTIESYQPCSEQFQCTEQQGEDTFFCMDIDGTGFKWYKVGDVWTNNDLSNPGQCNLNNFNVCSRFKLAHACAGATVGDVTFQDVYDITKFTGFCSPETNTWKFTFEADYQNLCNSPGAPAFNDPPVLMDLPDITLKENSGENRRLLNLNDFVTDPDSSRDEIGVGIVEETNFGVVDCFIEHFGEFLDEGDAFLSCIVKPNKAGFNDLSIIANDGEKSSNIKKLRVTVERTSPIIHNRAPQFKTIPKQFLDRNFNTHPIKHNNLIDLRDFAFDPENTFDELEFRILSQTNTAVVSCEVDIFKFIDCTVASNKEGTSTITLEVSDGSLRSITTFDVEVGDVSTTPTEPAPTPTPTPTPHANQAPILNIPDQTLTRNTGLNNDFLDLRNFASDPDDNVEDLTFTLVSQSNTNAVDCSLDNNRFIDCFVKNDVDDNTITVLVSDGELSSQDSFTISIEELASTTTNKVKKLSIETLFGYDEGDYYGVYAKVKNTGNTKSDVSVVLTIPGTNILDVRNIDINSKQSKWVIFFMEKPLKGIVAKLTADNGKKSEVKYTHIQ